MIHRTDIATHRTRLRRALLAFAGTAAAVTATTAQAGYRVETIANSGRSYDRGCAATYNYVGTGAAFILNDGSNASCPASRSFNGETVTVSGTTDTTGKLTSAHDASTVFAVPADAAGATADADLKTGKVHLTASAANFSEASASARFVDTLHFTVAGATASTVTDIPVSFTFDGRLVGSANPSAQLSYGFNFGSASAGDTAYYDGSYYPSFSYTSTMPTGGWVSSSFASYSPLDTRFSGIYAITGATADVAIDFRLALNATHAALDYSDGGSVSIGSAAGVSYTSDSGVFGLGGAGVGSVPEPASWAMLVAGFGIVGSAARQRRRRSVARV